MVLQKWNTVSPSTVMSVIDYDQIMPVQGHI